MKAVQRCDIIFARTKSEQLLCKPRRGILDMRVKLIKAEVTARLEIRLSVFLPTVEPLRNALHAIISRSTKIT